MHVGDHTYGHENVRIHFPEGKLTIGKFCSIGANCSVYLGGNHIKERLSTYPFGQIKTDLFAPFDWTRTLSTTNKDVHIGNDVWIANNVTIVSGVTVGDGAILANNSHVCTNVPAYAMYGGNPARMIRTRFDDSTVATLLDLRWWDWPIADISNSAPLLCDFHIEGLVRYRESMGIEAKGDGDDDGDAPSSSSSSPSPEDVNGE
jgi:acetyltransferase-like isoleucine patch superfamily enzyme